MIFEWGKQEAGAISAHRVILEIHPQEGKVGVPPSHVLGDLLLLLLCQKTSFLVSLKPWANKSISIQLVNKKNTEQPPASPLPHTGCGEAY